MARYMSGMDVLSHDDVLELLRRSVTEAGSQSAWADRHGLRQSTVADVLRGRWPPGPRILAALGLERVTGYRRASAEAVEL